MVAALAVALGAGVWLAWGGRTPEPPPDEVPRADVATEAPAFALGRRLFDEACRWIADGREGPGLVRDVHLALDARFDFDGTRHEGSLRLWLRVPDLYRQEMTVSNATTVKVMQGENLWVRSHDGQFTHVNRTPEGAHEVRQVGDDLERVRDMAAFLTLEGLKGPGVTFEFVGEKQPSGDFARPGGETWAKVVRRRPLGPDVTLWLAHTKDADGTLHATYPGVVRIEGQALADVPTEDYLLQDWTDAPPGAAFPFRRPARIRAYRYVAGETPLRFLDARVLDVVINGGIDAALFEPR